MTPVLWAWLLSLAGSLLFFVAGTTWSRLRAARGEADTLVTLGAELEETRAHMREQEQKKRELRGSETRLAGHLVEVQAEVAALEKELAHAEDEHVIVNAQWETEHARVAQLEIERGRATQQLAHQSAERESLEAKLAAARRAGTDPHNSALQQELALTREFLRAREGQLEQLREENARLHEVDSELARAKRELSELAEQTRLLRADAFASKRTPRKPIERPAIVSTRADALQLIVDGETEVGGAKSAVIADELGLVVAASGLVHEYGDALAALGAYLADVGSKTRGVLPLRDVRQVVIRDEHDMTLTVRPLVAEDPGLALVTLAVGANNALQFEDRQNRGEHADRSRYEQ
jgi:predicted regulator of Ras-like GTPase activity (Roadblock/LC7/MglB family)